jgi:four helix bundle protein
MKTESVIKDKTYKFALRTIKLYRFLYDEKQEFTLSKQILRSGTSIGALVREAEFGQSKKDFINKLSIALKEANETDYWLSLLLDSGYITQKMYDSIAPDITEVLKILVSIVNTSKKNLIHQRLTKLLTFNF